MVEGHGGGKLLTAWNLGERDRETDRERQREGGQGQD
jgi:hypothetical protein